MPAPDASTSTVRPTTGLTNSLANVLGLVVPLVVFFLATFYLVSRLGAEQFGVLTIFLAGVALLNSFDFGLGASGVRSLGHLQQTGDTTAFREALREWWSAYLVLAVLVVGGLLLVGPFLLDIVGLQGVLGTSAGWQVLGAFAVCIFFGFASAACQLIPRAKEMFVGLTFLQVISGVALWVGSALIASQDGGVVMVLYWVAILSLLSFLFMAWWASRMAGGINWCPRARFGRLRSSRTYGLYAFWAQVAGGVTYHFDKFIISHFLGPAVVGYYGIATNLSSKLLMLVANIAGFIFPKSVRLTAAGDEDGLRLTYLRASRYVLIVSWPMLVVAMLLAKPFVTLWLGGAVAATLALALPLLLLAYFVNSLSVVASNVFNGIGNAGIGAVFSTLGAIISIGGCIVLVPMFGLRGAALACLVASLQVFAYMIALHRRLKLPDWPFIGFWVQLLVVGSIQGMAIWLARTYATNWILLLCLGGAGWAVFYVIWFGFRFASADDKELVRRVLQGIMRRLSRQPG